MYCHIIRLKISVCVEWRGNGLKKTNKVVEDDFHLICKSTLYLSAWLTTIIVCPPGFYAAPPARKWVHAPGISPESSEEGGGQEDALQRFHHERMVSHFLFAHTIFKERTKTASSPKNECLRWMACLTANRTCEVKLAIANCSPLPAASIVNEAIIWKRFH